MQLQVAEPPDGLLGHFAGPQVHAPLSLDVSLAGPRDAAELQFQMGLGAAEMQGAGTLGLDPDSPKADVVLSIPALAPFSAMAGQNVAGSTKLHLVIAQQKDGGSALSLNGDIALTAAPYGVAKWVGPAGKFSLQANLQGQSVNIQKLEVSGAAFSAALSGNVAQSGVDLNTQITLPDVGAFAPGISGNLQEGGTVIGAPGDFAVSALLNGDITEGKIPSGPFSLADQRGASAEQSGWHAERLRRAGKCAVAAGCCVFQNFEWCGDAEDQQCAVALAECAGGSGAGAGGGNTDRDGDVQTRKVG